MKLAFIGPGTMGFGMAMNLAKGAEQLLVIARKQEKLAPFVEKGISCSTRTADAADCDIVFLCLPNGKIVNEVLFGEAAPAWHTGQIVVDMTTMDYRQAKELAGRFGALGISYLDAPVSGHRARALTGELSIMCGGDKKAFDAVRPYFAHMGEALYMGESGAGQLTKMINNCVMNICAASFCELMPLGVSMGLDAGKLGHVLTTASGASYVSRTLIPKILEGNFTHDFTMNAAYKDMVSMTSLLKEKGLELPTFEGTLATYERTLKEGYGELYKGAMILPYEEELGVKCRKDETDAEEKYDDFPGGFRGDGAGRRL